MKHAKFAVNLLLLLVVLELALTGFLSYETATSVTGFCVIGEDVGDCSDVQNSQYGEIFGIRLSYVGFFSFLVLFLVFLRDFHKKKISKLFFLLTLIGALFAVYLIFVQLFVLKQICTTCMIVDGLAVLIFFVSIMIFKKAPLV